MLKLRMVENLLIPFTAMAVAQLGKCIVVAFHRRRCDLVGLAPLLQPGGMPSSHSALVSSLACWLGLKLGFDSELFAMSFVFMVVTCYDAAGVRWQASLHAQRLNMLSQWIEPNIGLLRKGISDQFLPLHFRPHGHEFFELKQGMNDPICSTRP